jgi:dGTPase
MRSVFQHDYDRLLFSTPVRRLADKTQVWPMDENDSVRTRLTHSHEVANLARSIGARVYQANKDKFDNSGIGEEALLNVIQPILQATGLGHDLGNPPFGHQGETAIGRWFECRRDWIFSKTKPGGVDLTASQAVPEDLHSEFIEFDGNPQALRLLTRLQTHVDDVGLDLSAATLAAGLKYPVCFASADKNDPIKKKGGYFSSEKDVVDWIRGQTGLSEGQRHPLTWIMEACDDIAYSVLDIDDVLKKEVMSPDDVLIALRRVITQDQAVAQIHARFSRVEAKALRPDAQRDIKIQYLRACLIEALVTHASNKFTEYLPAIFNFNHTVPLMDGSTLCDALKDLAKTYAFSNPLVLKTEALGAAALDGLMSAFWSAISERKEVDNIESKKLSARSSYIFSLISPNYVQQANIGGGSATGANGLRYRELRLLTDMVSGMTDTYAMRLWDEIQRLPHVNSTQ